MIMKEELITMKEEQTLSDFAKDLDSYKDRGIFTDDTTDIYKVLSIIDKMPVYDKNILYLYSLKGTYAATAKELGICTSLAFRKIRQIKKYIIEHL